MKINSSFFLKISSLITQALLVLTLTGFTYAAIADDIVTDDQIRRVAKIAKATGTTITIVKERVTVTVSGGSKKIKRSTKKSVLNVMKPKKRNWQKVSSWQPESSDFARRPPALASASARPPALERSSARPPALEESAGFSGAPSLDAEPGPPQVYF